MATVGGVATIALAVPPPSQAFGPLSQTGLTTLANGGRAVSEATSVALSPDGRNAYVASQAGFSSEDSSGVAVFARNPSTGALSQLAGSAGCATVTGADGVGGTSCAMANGVAAAGAVAVSPDGKFVYVGAKDVHNAVNPGSQGTIAIFSRDPATGALSQAGGTAGCIGSGADPSCASGAPNLQDLTGLVVSPDGRFLYASAGEGNTFSGPGNGAVSVFSRNLATGALTQVQCMEYVRNGTSNSAGCTTARAMREPNAIALSPAGDQLYVAASEGGNTDRDGAIVTFNRDPNTGMLSQPSGAAGCIDATGTDDTTPSGTTCAVGRALHDAHDVTVSPDGTSVYVAAQGEPVNSSLAATGAVSLFSRNAATGTLTQLPGSSGCISKDGSNGYSPSPGTCATGRALSEPSGVRVSPDGQSVYVASSDYPSSLDVFARNPSTGALIQVAGTAGCISADGGDGHAGSCAQAPGIDGANGLTTIAGPRAGCVHVYLAAEDSAAVSSWARADCAVPAITPPTNTRITKSKINRKKQTARFKFAASGLVVGFQCQLIRKTRGKHHAKPKFKACPTPKTYRHLKRGRYTLKVRAFNSAGVDPRPATKSFRI